MNSAIHFFNSTIGRVLRVALGLALIGYGLFVLGGAGGTTLAIIGLAPIGLAIRGYCLLELVAPRGARAL